MKITYNQIVKLLSDFFESHYQVNDFKNGDLWEAIENDSFKDALYPLVFLVDAGANTTQGNIGLTFDLLCMDLVNKDESNENDVKSDTLRILTDTVAFLEQLRDGDWYSVNVVKESNLSSFTEHLNDELTGWKITVTLRQPFNYNACQIPYDGVSGGDDDCAPVTVTDSDGSTETEVPSGGSFACTMTPDSLYYPTKTGNSSFISGDDGITQTGRNVDYNTLDFTNPYGNTDRWTNDKGGDYSDNSDGSTVDYIVDNALKKGFKKTYGVRRTMQDHLAFAPTLTIGVYSDFTVANFNEYALILQPNSFLPNTSVFGNPDFNIILINKFRNSTTCFRAVSNSAIAQFSAVGSTPYQTIFIRNHTY